MNVFRKRIIQKFIKASFLSLPNKSKFITVLLKSTNPSCAYSFDNDGVFTQLRFNHTSAASNSTNDSGNCVENQNENTNKNQDLASKFKMYFELTVDDEAKKNILMILMEHEEAELAGHKVPSKISVKDMEELLEQPSFSARKRYMGYLFNKEVRKAEHLEEKELRKKQREIWLKEKEFIKPDKHIQYGIGHNTMILRVRRKSKMRYFNQKQANAILYGQKLVIDLDFDRFMRKRDIMDCGEQLLEMYVANRKNCYPYNLTLCNVGSDSRSLLSLRKHLPEFYSPDTFISVADRTYIDMFPKQKLVYITPFAAEPLKDYDHSAIYILAGLVDKCVRGEPVVLAKAKREGIRAVHLPFEQYIMWGSGSKNLSLKHQINILLEMKRTNDWSKAFRHVPVKNLVRSMDFFSSDGH